VNLQKLKASPIVRAAGIQALLLKERLATGVTFNPLSAALRENPYGVYHRLQQKDPVHWSQLVQGWVLSRYDDVSAMMRDPRFSAERENNAMVPVDEEAGPFLRAFSRTMLFRDPPDHTRLRTLVSKAFTPRAIEAMRPRIAQIVEELLDAVQDQGRMDIIGDLAFPLPVIVIAEMLGVPSKDRAKFKRWSDDLGEGLEPLLSDDQLRRANEATLQLTEYFRRIIHQRRLAPRDDLISAMCAAEQNGDALSEEELFSACILLLGAGNETTTNLIGNGMLALLRNPDQLRRLCDDPSRIGGAVEELLRYDSPVQMSGRAALQDVQIGDKTVRKGQFVTVLFGAANRDATQFSEPDRLDIGRAAGRHMAFGYGIHFCLGAPLARVEGQIAIAALLRRMPDVRLSAQRPRWRSTVLLRGLQRLPVIFRPVSKRPQHGSERIAATV